MRNVERTAQTRRKLLAAARILFAEHGYAATATAAILDATGMTRGALYHHFPDKAALFAAVCEELSAEAMAAIVVATEGIENPLQGLEAGSLAWIDYMLRPDVRRILLVEAPTVLGWQAWAALDQRHAFRLLGEGVGEAMAAGAIHFDGGSEALAVLLNGAMNAMALRLGTASGAEIAAGREAIRALIRAFAAK